MQRSSPFVFLFAIVSIALLSASADGTCNPANVYDAQITMSIDTMGIPAEFLVPMDPDRLTIEYQNQAYEFFSYYYGIDVSQPSDKWIVIPFQTNSSWRYSILSIAVVDPAIGTRRLARTPVSNGFVKDDGFDVFFLETVTVYGVYGGMSGMQIVGQSNLLYGNYRFFASCDNGAEFQVEQTIIYRGICPLTPVDYQGMGMVDLSFATSPFRCAVEHPVWGNGSSIGVAIYTAMGAMATGGFGGGMMMSSGNSPIRSARVVTVMTFPAALMDEMSDTTYCEDIIPTGDVCDVPQPYWVDNSGNEPYSNDPNLYESSSFH